MAEKVTTIHESIRERSAQEFFAHYGHIAVANVYDPLLGDQAASAAFRKTRLHVSDRLSGQTGDVRYSTNYSADPLSGVIYSAIQNSDLLGNPEVSFPAGKVRAQVIDHAPGAEGMWHKDNGIIVTTLRGRSWLEIDGEGKSPDAAYELVPGRMVVMNPSHRLLHRGVAASSVSRTGLAVERMQ